MKLAMGCDPAAYRFYQKLLERMRDEGYDIIDIGCESEQEADGGKYAEIAEIVSNKVVNRECDYGILICGTGQGMAMAANKIPGIRERRNKNGESYFYTGFNACCWFGFYGIGNRIFWWLS